MAINLTRHSPSPLFSNLLQHSSFSFNHLFIHSLHLSLCVCACVFVFLIHSFILSLLFLSYIPALTLLLFLFRSKLFIHSLPLFSSFLPFFPTFFHSLIHSFFLFLPCCLVLTHHHRFHVQCCIMYFLSQIEYFCTKLALLYLRLFYYISIMICNVSSKRKNSNSTKEQGLAK